MALWLSRVEAKNKDSLGPRDKATSGWLKLIAKTAIGSEGSGKRFLRTFLLDPTRDKGLTGVSCARDA